MSETDNRRIVEEMYAALNTHDPDRYVKNLDDSYVLESDAFPTPVRGREGAKQATAMYFKAFPDIHFETERIIASGDYVVACWHVTGTHKGEFNGISPTNRQVSSRGCTVSEIRNGRVIKSSIYSDQLAPLRQLGVSVGKVAGTAS
jgi:steroid delta-isomerase-like uncharacterized protein